MEKETTFKDTFNWLENNGWIKIPREKYSKEKKQRKHQTARVGDMGFFKLKKSNEEIKEEF